MEAIADPPAYDRARAAVRYDDIARALVLAFKYGDRLDLAPMMGRWMARAGHELLADADALVPVPLHWRRLWARRFNQSAALAGAISEPMRRAGAARRAQARARHAAAGRPVEDRSAPTTCRAPSACRRSKKPTSPAGALVLVDDVLTSGATVDTCARALLRAGRRPCRRAGICPGCGAGAQSHINECRNNAETPCRPSKSIPPAGAPIAASAKALLNRKGVAFTEIDCRPRPGAA